MQARFSRLAVLLTCLALGIAPASAAEQDEHAHGHEAGAAKLELDHGKKWGTDAPLRQGMSALRDAVSAEHHAIHHNRARLAKYQALAKKVDEQVAYMVANCKLSPEADANLHVILAEIIAGSDLMKGTSRAKARDGAVKIIGALRLIRSTSSTPAGGRWSRTRSPLDGARCASGARHRKRAARRTKSGKWFEMRCTSAGVSSTAALPSSGALQPCGRNARSA